MQINNKQPIIKVPTCLGGGIILLLECTYYIKIIFHFYFEIGIIYSKVRNSNIVRVRVRDNCCVICIPRRKTSFNLFG